MALATHLDGYIPEGILEGHLQVIRERGLNAALYADSIEPESAILADAIRAHADDAIGERADAELRSHELILANLENRPRAKADVKADVKPVDVKPVRH